MPNWVERRTSVERLRGIGTESFGEWFRKHYDWWLVPLTRVRQLDGGDMHQAYEKGWRDARNEPG